MVLTSNVMSPQDTFIFNHISDFVSSGLFHLSFFQSAKDSVLGIYIFTPFSILSLIIFHIVSTPPVYGVSSKSQFISK